MGLKIILLILYTLLGILWGICSTNMEESKPIRIGYGIFTLITFIAIGMAIADIIAPYTN